MPPPDKEQSILDGVAAGLIVIRPDGTVGRWNTWMVSASGRSSAAVAGKTIAEAFPGSTVGLLERAIDSALTGGASTLLTNALHASLLPLHTLTGRPLLHDVIVSPLANSADGCLVQVIDVTEATRRESFL